MFSETQSGQDFKGQRSHQHPPPQNQCLCMRADKNLIFYQPSNGHSPSMFK